MSLDNCSNGPYGLKLPCLGNKWTWVEMGWANKWVCQ